MSCLRHSTLKIFTIFSFLLIVTATTNAQDCIGNFELTSQAELAEFAELGCVNVIGNLKVGDYHVTDISALNTIKHVTGYLWVTGITVQDLNGLSSLESVDSFFLIYYTSALKNLNGLQNLKSVGNRFGISGNDNLRSIAYLDNLESIGRLEIRGNPFLDTLGEFPNLKHVGTSIEITQNSMDYGMSAFHNLEHATSIELSHIDSIIDGFDNLDTLERLKIVDNHILKSIRGFQSIKFIDNFYINDNEELEAIDGFDNLTKTEFFSISGSALIEIPDFPMLHNINILTLSFNPNLSQIQPFSSLDSVGSLTISYNDNLKNVTDFTFPSKMGQVSFYRNALLENISFTSTTDSIGRIEFYSNPSLSHIDNWNYLEEAVHIKLENLDSLHSMPLFPQLQTVTDFIRIGNIDPGTVTAFPQLTVVGSKAASGSGIFLDSLELISEGVSFPNLISTHHLKLVHSPFTDLEFFGQLNSISGDLLVEQNANLLSLFPNGKVKNVNGKITLQQNGILNNINGLDSISTSEVNDIFINNNPQLSACNSYWLCKAVNDGIPVNIHHNASGCVSEYDVRKHCDITYSNIVASAFYDKNQNGTYEQDEPLFSNAAFNILPDSITLLSDELPVAYYLPFGNYRVSSTYQNMHGWMLTNAQDTFDVTLDEEHDSDTLRFGYYPTMAIDSAGIFMNTTQNVSNRTSTLRTMIFNRGTTLFNGIVWIEIDTNVTNISFNIPPDYLEANKAGYDINNLAPGKRLIITIDYLVPGPPDFMFGSSLIFTSYVENEQGEILSTITIHPKVYSSFDPNDKAVFPARDNQLTLIEEELHYTIRFQNTGNFPATDVFIIDTLDSNLDISTLKVLSSSHLHKLVTSVNGQIVQFQFPNIYLIDSVANEPLSHGYLDFSIAPKTNSIPNIIVENKASIYFDANPPVVTNTTVNKLVDQLTDRNIRAWYADGQVWIVWNVDLPLAETVGVYASDHPFEDIADATLIGRPFVFEYLPMALKEQVDTFATYRIPDGNGGIYQLGPTEGLFVYTPHEVGAAYFAVVPWGENEVIASDNITDTAIEYEYLPQTDPVECHLQSTFPSPFAPAQYWCAAFYMWADGREDENAGRPDFPVMANAAKNGMPTFFIISVPVGLDTTQPFSLSVWLHGGGGIARQSLAGSRAEININPIEGILLAHNDDVFGYRNDTPPNPENPSFHFGYRKHWDPFTQDNFPTEIDTIINYTQRRYLWIDQWLIRHFNIDPARIYLHGHSMGSWGATMLAKAFPEHYASATLFNNGFQGPERNTNMEAMFGEIDSSYPTNLINRNGQTVHLLELFDLTTNISDLRDQPIIHSYHSKNDTGNANYWNKSVTDEYRKADSLALGYKLFWSERAHGVDTGPDFNDHWVSGIPANMQTLTDNVSYAELNYRSDLSYPAFYNHRLESKNNDPGDGTPGTGPGGVGDDWGTWGGYHRWDPISIIDQEHLWSVTAWLEENAIYSNDNSPNTFLTSEFAIRRPVNFKPNTGTMIYYLVDDLSGNSLQSGQIEVGPDDLITIPGITIFREDVSKVRIILTDFPVATEEPEYNKMNMQLRPNPAKEVLFIQNDLLRSQTGMISLLSVEGKVIDRIQTQFNEAGEGKLFLPRTLEGGIYLVKVQTREKIFTGMVSIIN